jgi:hypothetical protein
MTIPMLTDAELANVIATGALVEAVPAGVTVGAPITYQARLDPPVTITSEKELPSNQPQPGLPSDGWPTYAELQQLKGSK